MIHAHSAPCASICPSSSRACSRGSLAGRRGFTLLEVLIIVVILGILAAMVFPPYNSMVAESRAKAAASNVQKVRELIEIHSNSGEYARSAAGYPVNIFPDWFTQNELPENPWSSSEFNVDVVAAGWGQMYPLAKTFDPGNAAAASAWYNTDNGSFVTLIPPQGNDTETLALFNTANILDLGDLGDIN